MTMVDIRTPYIHLVTALCVLSIAVALTPRLPDLANPSSDFFTAGVCAFETFKRRLESTHT
jgi:hypothetical protein